MRKVVYWKKFVPDFKTLALASVIIPDFVEEEFLPLKQHNISSLCHKIPAETAELKKNYIQNKIINQTW